MSEVKPGIYAGNSNAEYHSGPGISKSGLDMIRRSPLHYQHAQTTERKEPTPDQRIGSLAHTLILEPEKFDEEYAMPFVAPENAISTTDEIKAYLKEIGEKTSGRKDELIARLRAADPGVVFLDEARAEYEDSTGDRVIVSQDELDRACAMRDAVMSHPAASKLLSGDGVAELSCYWNDPDTDILCRCRPDWWRDDGVIVDLKTTVDASPSEFERSSLKWGYHRQAAFYLDGIREAISQSGDGKQPRAFVFVAVEKTPPHAVAVYHMDNQSVEIGRREYREALDAYDECLRDDFFGGYGDRIQPLSLPAWRLRQDDFERDQGEVA